MRKLIYTDTKRWVAFHNSEIPITLSIYQTPSGFSVYIDGENKKQALSAVEAKELYRSLSSAVWGKAEEPTIPEQQEKDESKLYCKTCGREIGWTQLEYDGSSVTKTYIVKKTLEHSCCRKSRKMLLK